MMNRPSNPTRREWLSFVASCAIAQVAPARLRAARDWGVQLYTVRDRLRDRGAETLKAIAAIGYKELELGRAQLSALAPLARDVGLTPVSVHIEAPLVTGNWGAWGNRAPKAVTLQRAVEEVRTHGVKYGVVSYLMPAERGTNAAWYERFADQMNRAGEVARRAGLTLGYHNHGFEFETLSDGSRPLDVLVNALDPALVRLEVDVFWVSITGADPLPLLLSLGNRVALVHLKDKARDAPAETDEREVATSSFVEVGSGALDFRAILRAADAAGVQHFFVEQDHTPGDPLASLAKSYAHLQSLT
jgi:sugar phosphate isomerase/epimerase